MTPADASAMFDAGAELVQLYTGFIYGGPGLAAAAIAAGLVDELHLFLTPVVVGGGTAALPDGVRVELELLDEHRFAGGVVHLHYSCSRP